MGSEGDGVFIRECVMMKGMKRGIDNHNHNKTSGHIIIGTGGKRDSCAVPCPRVETRKCKDEEPFGLGPPSSLNNMRFQE